MNGLGHIEQTKKAIFLCDMCIFKIKCISSNSGCDTCMWLVLLLF